VSAPRRARSTERMPKYSDARSSGLQDGEQDVVQAHHEDGRVDDRVQEGVAGRRVRDGSLQAE